MGKGDSRPTHRPKRPGPAAQSAANKPASGPAAPKLAGPGPTRIPKSSTPPLTSRTATLDDPLTTSLLAEIARRPTTVEMSPAQIAAARAMAPAAQEPADDGADGADGDGAARDDRDPGDPA